MQKKSDSSNPLRFTILWIPWALNLTQLNLTQPDPVLPKPVPNSTKTRPDLNQTWPNQIIFFFMNTMSNLTWPNWIWPNLISPRFYPSLFQLEPNPVPAEMKPDPLRFSLFYEYHEQLNLTQFNLTQLDPIWPGFTRTCPNLNRILSRPKPKLTQ